MTMSSSAKRRRQSECVTSKTTANSTSSALELELPCEILDHALFFCLPVTVAACASKVCRTWRDVALGMERWEALCCELWRQKTYVPRRFLNNPSAASYFESILDARRTHFESADELCQQHFHFRFSEGAGEYWYARDPAFFHPELNPDAIPMYRRFMPSAELSHLPPEEAPVDDGSGVSGGGGGEQNGFARGPAIDPLESDPEIQSFVPSIRWRFTKSRDGRRGQFIKLNNWPSYVITRNSLKANGGCLRGCAAATDASGEAEGAASTAAAATGSAAGAPCGCDDWGWTLESEWVKMRTCCAQTFSRSPVWLTDSPDF